MKHEITKPTWANSCNDDQSGQGSESVQQPKESDSLRRV